MTELYAEDVVFFSKLTYRIFQVFGWSALFIGALVAYLVLFHSSFYSDRYRAHVLYLQAWLTFDSVTYCLLLSMYPLFPHPAVLCQGIVCTHTGLSTRAVLAIELTMMAGQGSAMALCLLSRHQVIIGKSSRWALNTIQKALVTFVTLVLFGLNPLAFYLGGRGGTLDAQALLSHNLSTFLRNRKLEYFSIEQLFPVFVSVVATMLWIFPLTAFLMGHSMLSLHHQVTNMSKRTRLVQKRSVLILAVQFSVLTTCVVIPFVGSAICIIYELPFSSHGMSLIASVLVIVFPFHPIASSIFTVLLNPRYIRLFKQFMRGQLISEISNINSPSSFR